MFLLWFFTIIITIYLIIMWLYFILIIAIRVFAYLDDNQKT